MWRYLIPVGLFGALIAFFFFGLDRDKETLPSPLIGKPAPIFTLPRVEDLSQTISNADFKGQPYVLNVWATWCVGCRQEHQALMTIAQRNEVPLLGLDWNDNRDAALRWLDTLGDPYVGSAYDPEGRIALDWGVYAAPETFFIDAQGIIRHKHFGPISVEIWDRDFVPLIKQAQATR